MVEAIPQGPYMLYLPYRAVLFHLEIYLSRVRTADELNKLNCQKPTATSLMCMG